MVRWLIPCFYAPIWEILYENARTFTAVDSVAHDIVVTERMAPGRPAGGSEGPERLPGAGRRAGSDGEGEDRLHGSMIRQMMQPRI
jgi:hypothetical protein